MISVPHTFYVEALQAEKLNFSLPEQGNYATGICFLQSANQSEAKNELQTCFDEITKNFKIEVSTYFYRTKKKTVLLTKLYRYLVGELYQQITLLLVLLY